MGVPPTWVVPTTSGSGDDAASFVAFGLLAAALLANYIAVRRSHRRDRALDIQGEEAPRSEHREHAAVP
jgi:hypothetical protein